MYNSNDIKLLFVSALILVVIDFIYLSSMKNYFSNQVIIIQETPFKMNIPATILCYIILVFGFNYFIVKPKREILDAFLLGILIYGVFETTNKGLFSNWKWTTVIMDTLWGGILFALTLFIMNTLINKKYIS